ncbi:MAG: hypothetical protein HY914_21525 [Desulfomonile tiedjei]|nr:hypothetical protein [Desulfomonile tiedjei]
MTPIILMAMTVGADIGDLPSSAIQTNIILGNNSGITVSDARHPCPATERSV